MATESGTDNNIAVDWEGHCRTAAERGTAAAEAYEESRGQEGCGQYVLGEEDALAAERVTYRSIQRDRTALTERLKGVRYLNAAGALRDETVFPRWFFPDREGFPNCNWPQPVGDALPLRERDLEGRNEAYDLSLNIGLGLIPEDEDEFIGTEEAGFEPTAAVLGTEGGINYNIASDLEIGDGSRMRDIAKAAVTWRTTFASYPNPSADDFEPTSPFPGPEFENYGRSVMIGASFGAAATFGSRPEIAEQRREIAASFRQAPNIREYVVAEISNAIREYDYGSAASTAATPGRMGQILEKTRQFFGADPTEYIERDEGALVRDAVGNFAWLYYSHIIISKMDAAEAASFLASDLSSNADDIFSHSIVTTPEVQQFNSAQEFFDSIANLIVRYRAHQIILDFNEELDAQAAQNPDSSQSLRDAEGFLTTEGRRRKQRAFPLTLRRYREESTEDCNQSANRRLAEQCFLVDFLPTLAAKSQRRAVQYQTFTPLHGDTDSMVNKLVYSPQLECMDTLTPAEMSTLVPKIRIYKIVYDSDDSRRTPYEQEVPFDNSSGESEIRDMMTGGTERGRGSGITSFDWTLDGQNPFASRRFINAKLQLFFQSMKEFLEPLGRPAAMSPRGPMRQPPILHFVDLVNTGRSERLPSLEWNPDYYKLRIEVGWTLPEDDLGVFTGDIECKKKAIRDAKLSMFVTATEHEIDIDDQGSVRLTIDYTAWQEASYSDGESDILATEEIKAIRANRRARISQARQESEDLCDERLLQTLEEIKEEYTAAAREENYTAWQRLLNALTRSDPPKVFAVPVPVEQLEQYYTALCSGAGTDGITDLLFGPGYEGRRANLDNVDVADAAAENVRQMASSISTRASRQGDNVLQTLEDIAWDEVSDEVIVQFFYLGDLIEAALSLVNDDKFEKNCRVLLAPISIHDPVSDEIVSNINLADIPISVKFFIEWFLQDVIGQNKKVYPAMSFIQNLLTSLVQPVITRQCKALRNVPRQRLQLRTNFFSAGGRPGSDPLSSKKNIIPTESGGRDYTRVDIDAAFRSARRRGRSILNPPGPGSANYHYMLIYPINSVSLRDLNGSPNADASRGIYHFGIGRNSGLLKSIKFSKSDFSLREARIENEILAQATGLAVLANVYTVKIRTFGNTLFYPGSRIYVDPSGLGGLGSPTRPRSAARQLGIGGYHVVYNVQSFIESGKFETVVDALWEMSGGEGGRAEQVQDAAMLASCARRVRSLTAPAGEGDDETPPSSAEGAE